MLAGILNPPAHIYVRINILLEHPSERRTPFSYPCVLQLTEHHPGRQCNERVIASRLLGLVHRNPARPGREVLRVS